MKRAEMTEHDQGHASTDDVARVTNEERVEGAAAPVTEDGENEHGAGARRRVVGRTKRPGRLQFSRGIGSHVLIGRHRLFAALLIVAALPACARDAAANIPDPITKINTVRVLAGDLSDGRLTTEVSYTDTAASAAASTGDSIALASGFSFLLRTCLAYHLHGTTPVSSCATRSVDTRPNDAPIYTHAPPVTLAGQPRPTSQPWGYFTAYTDVLHLNAGAWAISAHSWPADGLQGAGIAVAAQGQETGTLAPNSTVTVDGPFTGAIGSGQPDSICTTSAVASDGSALPAGVSTSHPAFFGAPTYYEVGSPTGAHAGQAPRGVMLVIHGGGWTVNSVGLVESMRADADRWRARGWQTVNLSYRACAESIGDVLWFYDNARAWFGSGAAICALGTSAGGHLALLIGARRPDLFCAVSQAGPTDLIKIQHELAYDKASGLHTQTNGGRQVHNLAAAAFGAENLSLYSPAAQASETLKSTRVLQGFSADDALVPYQQTTDLSDAMRAADPYAYVESMQLATGTIPFGHGLVSQAALDDFYDAETELVAPVTTQLSR
jgi:acetyl esterase/lipase